MSWVGCICGTIIGLVFLFIVAGIPTIVYQVVVKPRDPTFTLEWAAITGFNLTSDGHLTSFFDVQIRAHNPNHKLKLKYQRVRVSVYKDKQNLGTDALPGFTQRKRNVTLLTAQPVALNVSLKKGPAFNFGLESGMGYLDFDVFMTAFLNGHNLEVNCKHAVVNLTAPTNDQQNFRGVKCGVQIYSNDV